MGDSENSFPPSKKRAAGRELSRDNPGLDDEEDSAEQETGTFKRASDEVLSSRRIVKVRRNPTSSIPSSNPFAGICLVPSTEPGATPVESKTTLTEVTTEALPAGEKTVSDDVKNDVSKETEGGKNEHSVSENVKNDASEETDRGEDEKAVPENVKNDASKETEKHKDENSKQSENKLDETVADAAVESAEVKENSDTANEAAKPGVDDEKESGGDTIVNEDKKNSTSENAEHSAEGTPLSSFQQLSSSKNAFTGLAGTGFCSTTFSFGSIPKDGYALGTSSGSLFGQKNDQPSFGFGASNNGNSSLFKASTSIVSKSEGSGFRSMNEVLVETGEENETVVFSADSVLFEFLDGSWKERGKGELKVNVSTTETERARLLMRARGNYRLILNASLYPDMKLTNMEKKGITFACVNSTGEGKDGLSTFALKFKDATIVGEFRAAVVAHKGKTEGVLKTPENSPKASEN